MLLIKSDKTKQIFFLLSLVYFECKKGFCPEDLKKYT